MILDLKKRLRTQFVLLACVFLCPVAALGYNVDLDFNWNGLAHNLFTDPDSANGFRSVADRALTVGLSPDSLTGTGFSVTTSSFTYTVVSDPNALDVVFIGERQNNSGTIVPGWDFEVDGDHVGIAPLWDPTGGTGQLPSATTILETPTVPLDASFKIGFLFNASQGGGNVDVNLGFTDGSAVTVQLNAPDWFADNNLSPSPPVAGIATQALLSGPLSGGDGFDATELTDLSIRGGPLNVVEATITYASLLQGADFDVTGRQLGLIMFSDPLFGQPLHHSAFTFIAAATNAAPVPEPHMLTMLTVAAVASFPFRRSQRRRKGGE